MISELIINRLLELTTRPLLTLILTLNQSITCFLQSTDLRAATISELHKLDK